MSPQTPIPASTPWPFEPGADLMVPIEPTDLNPAVRRLGPRTQADVDRVNMALAEAGYPPEATLFVDEDAIRQPAGVPDVVMWRALVLAGVARQCWPCVVARSTSMVIPRCGHVIDLGAAMGVRS